MCMVNDIEKKELVMDIHTLQLAIDTLNGKISRAAGASSDTSLTEWEHGVVAGLVSARNDLEYMLETEVLYRDSKEAA